MADESNLKAGQKFPTPTPGNGDRVFYETLFRQRPDSEMAQEWCVAYGVLPDEEAARVHKAVFKRKGVKKLPGGTTTNKSNVSKGSSKKVQKVLKDVEYDAEMAAVADEGIGIAGL